jgi:uncharacterized membrane protein YukC
MNIKTITILSAFFLTACANVGTPPEQITGSYVSPVKYERYTCSQLATESASLARRINILNTAQNSRISSNQVQAFWLGYGNGDGIEAAELANVKGDIEAVRSAMHSKNCR